MTVGAYDFDKTIDFIKPARGKDCVLTDGASIAQASMGVLAASLVALSLY